MTKSDSSNDARVVQHDDRVDRLTALLETIIAADLVRPETVIRANNAFHDLCAELGDEPATRLLATLPRVPGLILLPSQTTRPAQ